MNDFIDLRTNPAPDDYNPSVRLTTEPDDIANLHQLCRDGRLYDVERWIQAGRSLQLTEELATDPRRRFKSPIQIALETGNHSLVLLLLCNGYDPNLERYCPLDLALQERRFDLVDLLLDWGTDPHQVDLSDLFDTYNSKLFERFRGLGVDLTAGHVLAAALAYHTSNKPLYGFARRHRKSDPKIQREIDIALGHHAWKGNERGVALCLWAGADPHAPAPDLRHGPDLDEEDGDDEYRFVGFNAINEACRAGNIEILDRLGPNPAKDDFEELYRVAGSGAIVEYLARLSPPRKIGTLLQAHLSWFPFSHSEWKTRRIIERIFALGARWEPESKEEIAAVRHVLRDRTSDRLFIDVMKLLAKNDHCSSETLMELARTPAFRRRMREVGFIPTKRGDKDYHSQVRPTRSRQVLRKCGVKLAKQKRPLPRRVTIGRRRKNTQETHLSREELYERVWSTPVSILAEEWGLSDRGLSKACRKLKIPVPPRGYWAKVEAGKRVRRAKLAELPAGEAEEVVVWANSD